MHISAVCMWVDACIWCVHGTMRGRALTIWNVHMKFANQKKSSGFKKVSLRWVCVRERCFQSDNYCRFDQQRAVLFAPHVFSQLSHRMIFQIWNWCFTEREPFWPEPCKKDRRKTANSLGQIFEVMFVIVGCVCCRLWWLQDMGSLWPSLWRPCWPPSVSLCRRVCSGASPPLPSQYLM